MSINNVNSQPAFCAKIKIKKSAFKNIGSDLVDSGVMSFDSGASASINMSAFSSPSVLKDPKIGNDGFVPAVKTLADDFEQRGLALSARNIYPFEAKDLNAKDINLISAESVDFINNSAVSTVGSGLQSVNSSLKSINNDSFIFKIKSGINKLISDLKEFKISDKSKYKERAQISAGSGLISTGITSYGSSVGVGLENTAFHSDMLNSVSSPLKNVDLIKYIHQAHRPDTTPLIGYSGRSLFASSGASIGLGSQTYGLKVLNKADNVKANIPS